VPREGQGEIQSMETEPSGADPPATTSEAPTASQNGGSTAQPSSPANGEAPLIVLQYGAYIRVKVEIEQIPRLERTPPPPITSLTTVGLDPDTFRTGDGTIILQTEAAMSRGNHMYPWVHMLARRILAECLLFKRFANHDTLPVGYTLRGMCERCNREHDNPFCG
jgi:hypothetical protein